MNKEPFVEAILTVADVLRDMVREEVRAAIRPEQALQAEYDALRARVAELEQDKADDDELIGEIQNLIRDGFMELFPDVDIDGSGTDADWSELTKYELFWGFELVKEALADRDEALRKLRELAGLARAAVGDDYQGDVDPLVDWLQAHTELWGGFPDEDAHPEEGEALINKLRAENKALLQDDDECSAEDDGDKTDAAQNSHKWHVVLEDRLGSDFPHCVQRADGRLGGGHYKYIDNAYRFAAYVNALEDIRAAAIGIFENGASHHSRPALLDTLKAYDRVTNELSR